MPAALRNWLVIALILVGLRFIAGFFLPLPLQVDEAQYLGWASQPALGYFSKPPFIAWVLRFNTFACEFAEISNQEGCARALQPLALSVAAIFSGLAAFALYRNKNVAIAAVLILICSPLFGFYSSVATTDAWLLMWWAIAFWLFVEAQEHRKTSYLFWVACGVSVGFGFLSKYSMGIFVLSALTWLVYKRNLLSLGPWIAAIAGILVFSPNILWNYQNGFPTFAHHLEISQVADLATKNDWILKKSMGSFIAFLWPQFFLLSPLVLFSAFFARSQASKSMGAKTDERVVLLLMFSIPILLVIGLQAFLSRAHANWAAPAYITLAILAAATWFGRETSSKAPKVIHLFLQLTLLYGLAVSALLMTVPKYFYWNSNAPRVRAIEQIRGWKEVALALSAYAEKHKLVVVAEDRRVLAALHAYTKSSSVNFYAYDREQRRNNHYTWFFNVEDKPSLLGKPILFVKVQDRKGDYLTEIPGFEKLSLISLPKLTGGEIYNEQTLVYQAVFVGRK